MTNNNKFKIGVSFLLIFILFLTFCTSKREKRKQQEIQAEQIQSDEQKTVDEKHIKEQKALNDSLSKKLYERFPFALRTDSIQDSFTYYFQKLLEKSSNLLYIEEAWIKDIEEINGSYLISIYNYNPKMVGKFLVNSQLSTRLLKELKPNDMDEICCLVVKVNGIIPIRTDVALKIEKFNNTQESTVVSEKNIKDYVHMGFDSNFSPFYLINGELIDFYILK